MKSGLKKPISLVFFGVFALSLAGFFTIMHVGMSSRRQAGGIVHGFGYRGPTGGAVEPGYAADFKRGSEIIADKASDFFSWQDEAPAPAGVLTASARQDEGGGEEAAAGESDPFEDFYKKNYGRSSAAAAPYGSGGGSVSSWSGSGDTMTSGGRPGAPAAAAGADEDAAAPAAAGLPSGSPVPGAQAKGDAAASGPQASLPKGGQPFQGLERAGELSGGKLPGGGSPGIAGGPETGKLSGMPGQKGTVDLNGAAENSRIEGTENFKKIAGGKSEVAAGGGGAAGTAKPAAPTPGGGSSGSGGGSSGSGGSSGATAAKDGAGSTPSEKAEAPYRSASPDGSVVASARQGAVQLASADPDFLKAVVTERLKGAEADYVTEEDAAGEPEQGQLKSGAVIAAVPQVKALAAEGEKEPEVKPDPEKFEKLSSARKKELKTNVHGFLKRVENRYGTMAEIFFTPCSQAKELCGDHGLTEGYLTMRTSDGAKLILGLKYIKTRWRPYTVSFGTPIRLPKQAPAAEPPAEEPAGDPVEEPDPDWNDDGLMWV